MKTTPIINRLKAECPSLEGRVAGAAGLAAALETAADWAVPHAFVVAISDAAEDNELLGDVSVQEVRQTIGVAVVVDNSSDEPGHTASEQVVDLLVEIRTALQGWEPSSGYRQFDYLSGALGEFDRARLWWEFLFATTTEIVEG